MKYSIIIKKSAIKEIRKLPRIVVDRLQKAIGSLRETPVPKHTEKIHGYDHYYRIRVGDYRIVYEVQKTVRIISVIKIGHRKDVYKKL